MRATAVLTEFDGKRGVVIDMQPDVVYLYGGGADGFCYGFDRDHFLSLMRDFVVADAARRVVGAADAEKAGVDPALSCPSGPGRANCACSP